MREGWHPDDWRVEGIEGPRKKIIGAGGRLGPMGELGQSLIFSIHVTEYGKKLMLRGIREFTKTRVWKTFTNLVYDPLQVRMGDKVDKWVPADTKRLRQSMKASITPAGGSHVEMLDMIGPNGFTVLLGTPGIKYAKVVNRMPERWLRHPGKHSPGTRGRTGKTLSDPQARKGWYNLVLLDSRSFVKSRMSIFRKRMTAVLGGGRQGYNEFRRCFQIVYK